jgi:hypothetical protein
MGPMQEDARPGGGEQLLDDDDHPDAAANPEMTG